MTFEKSKNEKNENLSSIVSYIGKNLAFLLKVIPVLGVTFSLYLYARAENIDIFVHYSFWVSALPVIVVGELILGALYAVCVFIPVSTLYVLLWAPRNGEGVERPVQGIDWSILSRREKLHLIKPGMQLFLLVILPVAFVTGILASEWWFLLLYFVLIAVAILFFEEKAKRLLKSYDYIGIAFVSVLSNSLFFHSTDPEWGWTIWFVLMATSSLYYFNNYHSRFISYILAFLSFFYMYATPFSLSITRPVLRSLGMGGGVEKVYYVNSEDAKKIIPYEFLNDKCCVDIFCFTNKLSIIWGVGNLVYVDVPSKKDPPVKQHIAIPRNILMPYKLDEPLPDVCKTEEELEEATNQGQEEQG